MTEGMGRGQRSAASQVVGFFATSERSEGPLEGTNSEMQNAERRIENEEFRRRFARVLSQFFILRSAFCISLCPGLSDFFTTSERSEGAPADGSRSGVVKNPAH